MAELITIALYSAIYVINLSVLNRIKAATHLKLLGAFFVGAEALFFCWLLPEAGIALGILGVWQAYNRRKRMVAPIVMRPAFKLLA